MTCCYERITNTKEKKHNRYKLSNTARTWVYILDAVTSKSELSTDENPQKRQKTTATNDSEEHTNTGLFSSFSLECSLTIVADIYAPTVSNDIPEHDNFALYGPSFTLSIPSGKNINQKTYVRNLMITTGPVKSFTEDELQEIMKQPKHVISQMPQK